MDLTQAVESKPVVKEKQKEIKPQQVNLIGIDSKKEDNFSKWYQEAISRSEMLEYYDVSGCYILRPWAYGIWERIQKFFDDLIMT